MSLIFLTSEGGGADGCEDRYWSAATHEVTVVDENGEAAQEMEE